MSPYEQASELYRASSSNLNFSDDLNGHMEGGGGYALLTPEFYVLARPVRRDWPSERIANPRLSERRENADCWFIWLLCGSLKEAVKHLPYPLKWVGFSQRGQPARFIELEKALAKIK